jgi:hypothetical protein
MSYYYESNLDSLNRLDQVEIQLDNGDAAILRKGHYYDLTAGELQRARQYIVLTSSTVPADEQPIGVRYLPLKGNPTADQIPQWSANEAAFIPATVSGVSGGPYATAADLDVIEAGLTTAQAGVDAATADLVSLKASPINVLDYGADPTGVTSSVAAFAAAVAACIPNTSPVTTARYAKRALYIPGGYYMTNTTALLSLTSVIGLRVLTDGPYATIFRADASMESIVDLNGIAHCHFDGFTCQSKSNGNDASVVVQKPFKMYWDNTTAARSTTDNRFEAIIVSDCRFVRGTQIGLDGSGLQCDSTQIDRCVVVGQAGFGYGDVANTTSTLLNCVVTAMAIGHELYGYGIQAGTTIANIVGSTITMSLPATASLTHSFIFSTAPGLWQRGIGVGSGVAGNNYGHHITMAQGGNVRYGLYVANTSGVIEQWDGLTNQTDFFFAGVGDGSFAIKSGRGEGSQRMMDTTGASSLSNNIEISDMIWFGNRQHGDRGWVKYFSGGSISLNRVKCYGLDATQPITPAVVITPNAVPRQMTHLTLDGCSIQAPLATLLNQTDTLRANVNVRGYSEISSGLTPVKHTALYGSYARADSTVLYVDPAFGNDANDGRLPGIGGAFATIAAAYTALPAGGGELRLSAGVHTFGNLGTMTKPVALIGTGWFTSVGAVFGNSAWTTSSNHMGTVLVSTATTGYAMEFSGGRPVLRDLLLVGPGTGTSTGLRLNSLRTGPISNVKVANFSVGVDLNVVYESTFVSLQARGCPTCLRINDSNQNVFLNTEIEYSTGDGLLIGDSVGANLNCFYGGVFQNIVSGNSAIRQVAGLDNKFDGIWFEGTTGVSHTVDFVGGTAPRLTNCHYSSNVVDLVRNACNSARIGPLYTVDIAKVVEITSAPGDVVLDQPGGTVQDSGTRTVTLGAGVHRLAAWLADDIQSVTLGTITKASLVLRVGIFVSEAFNSSGTDTIEIGGTGLAARYAAATDVSTTGPKTPAAGSLALPGTMMGGDAVSASYTNGGTEPTTGKALVFMEYMTVPNAPA